MAISASIQALVAGNQIPGSRLGNKLLEELMAEGLLLVTVHGSRKTYRARDIEALRRYLIDKDESYRLLEHPDSHSRATMAQFSGNSKLVTLRSCPGFPINSYEPINCTLNGKPFAVNPQEGIFLFITDWSNFIIPEDIIVIGVENMENFRMIRKQKALFDKYLSSHNLPTKILFVSRYPQSTDLRRWLLSIPNFYLHFGDFDLAGVTIYLSEFKKYLGAERSSFLIPDDIAFRLKSGSQMRYNEQYEHFKNMKSDIKELQQLINLIHQERKGYDQEGYIR